MTLKNKYLLNYRKKHGLTQVQMAVKCGLPFNTYQSYENMTTGTSESFNNILFVLLGDYV